MTDVEPEDDDDGEEDGEEDGGTEEPGEPGDQAPALATGPIIQDYVDVPSLGFPVGNGNVDAITTAKALLS